VRALSVERYKNALFLPDSDLWNFLEQAGTREVFRFIYDITL
jgi:hypothetical protein